MTAVAWVFAIVFAIAAVANWWSRWTEDRSVELWSKPLALIALIGVALALDPLDPATRAWFVVALVCSLAGDVFLLDGDKRFIPGLVRVPAGAPRLHGRSRGRARLVVVRVPALRSLRWRS